MSSVLTGRLRNVPLGEVFQVLVTGRKVGTLEVRREDRVAVLELDEGRIRYASMRPGVHLGEILVRMDLLSTAEVQDLLAGQTREHAGAPLGFAARRLGLVDDDALARAVRRQVGEVVADLLHWRDGAFTFTDAAIDRTYVPDGQAVDAMAVLLEVTSQLQDEAAARVDPGAVYDRAGDPTAVTLIDGAWDVLEQLDGRRTARAVAAELDMPQRRVFGVLGRLEARDVVRRVALVADEPQALVLCPSEAIQRLLGLLVLRSGGVPVIVGSVAEARSAADGLRPRAVVIDDDGHGWRDAEALRSEPGVSHLPMALITASSGHAGWRWWRRPKVDVLARPFEESALRAWLERWLVPDALRG